MLSPFRNDRCSTAYAPQVGLGFCTALHTRGYVPSLQQKSRRGEGGEKWHMRRKLAAFPSGHQNLRLKFVVWAPSTPRSYVHKRASGP